MRILTNYFQLLTLTQSFELSWSDQLKTFMETISIIAKSSDIVLSVDCFIRKQTEKYEPIFVKMILACVILVGALAFVLAFWGVVAVITKRFQIKRNIIISTIVIIFVFLPAVSSITMSIFSCIDIFKDGNSYLALDLSIKCWSGDQDYYAKRFGLAIVFIWILGFPLLGLFILIKNRRNLEDDNIKSTYGFLYIGLNHKSFYWEIMLHFRKILIISINVFFGTFVSLYRAIIGFVVMVIYIEML
mmetsp:Transcript_10414/g.10442  ORF Transcript_10414/g.10442 Transcript_10414/m.10442 type:complete len:245 (-) Transcript_10414:395-1129(-)